MILLRTKDVPTDLAEFFEPVSTTEAKDVLRINPRPYPEAHFATFPPELPRLCILAGTSAHGVCPHCNAPWERVLVTKSNDPKLVRLQNPKASSARRADGSRLTSGTGHRTTPTGATPSYAGSTRLTSGQKPTCTCPDNDPVPATVLDPFAGSGTTLAVATSLGRKSIGIEIKPDYIPLIDERVRPEEEVRSAMSIFDLATELGS